MLSISSALDPHQRLWRYTSIDKLIDLLSTQTLFMASAEQFRETDPLEGQDHPQVTRVWAQMMKPYFDQHHALRAQMHVDAEAGRCDVQAFERYKHVLARLPTQLEETKKKLERSVRFCCWHANEVESEAMWKLYGDSGKSVAIVTTVQALADSLRLDEVHEELDIVPVKYLDFAKQYAPPELKAVGARITVTKRMAYQHEQEVRLTVRPITTNPRDWDDPSFGRSEPLQIPVNVANLIHEVHISPYPSQPFEASVRTVCELYGIRPERIRTSSLLRLKRESLAALLDSEGSKYIAP